jgi:hypothetical protein
MANPIEKFTYISQRAANSYLKSLAPIMFVMPEVIVSADQAEMEASQRDLHGFFQALYQCMVSDPEVFGLSLTPDDGLDDHEENMTQRKQELNLKLKKPREVIAKALAFLMLAGDKGELQAQSLVLVEADYAGFVGRPKTLKTLLAGMESAGLMIHLEAGNAVLHSERFPKMFPALQQMAQTCTRAEDAKSGRFNFARCDFQALKPGYSAPVAEIYQVFSPTDLEYVLELHQFFLERKYKTEVNLSDIYGWVVKYQGDKKIKASPLFQVEYSERFYNPLRLYVKCASTARIVPVLEQQPELLQNDFRKRIIKCGDCGWCKNSKILGPTEYAHKDEQFKICWYTFPDVYDLGPETVQLIKQYALMHEALPKLK